MGALFGMGAGTTTQAAPAYDAGAADAYMQSVEPTLAAAKALNPKDIPPDLYASKGSIVPMTEGAVQLDSAERMPEIDDTLAAFRKKPENVKQPTLIQPQGVQGSDVLSMIPFIGQILQKYQQPMQPLGSAIEPVNISGPAKMPSGMIQASDIIGTGGNK